VLAYKNAAIAASRVASWPWVGVRSSSHWRSVNLEDAADNGATIGKRVIILVVPFACANSAGPKVVTSDGISLGG
jgi:hypothetical protein